MAKIIKANGEIKYVTPHSGSAFTLEELQNIVGGYIEIVHLMDVDNTIIVLNEEGKLMGLKYNPKATELCQKHHVLMDGDFIVGDVIHCRIEQV